LRLDSVVVWFGSSEVISSGEPEVNKQSLGWMEALINWKARFNSSEVDLF
jgi:hypothetical protein